PMAADEDVMITAIIAPSENMREGSSSFDNAGQVVRAENRATVFNGREPQPSSPIPLVGTANGGPQPSAEIDSLPQLGPPTTPHPDELATAALMAMGPYTTFQQLSFAPNFPLATLAEECIIPPSYRAVKEYKKIYEPEERDTTQGTETSETPEDFNAHLHDVQWFYKDPKGVVRGPWPSSLMQSWFNDGFLPLDLPVRRENEDEYISLQTLQSQSIDSTSPFRPPPPGLALPITIRGPLRPDGVNPLLDPVSLLTQEKRFGPPALFYCSRGGHSTSIVDGRGRSVLKGRLHWTSDDTLQAKFALNKLGDVKRLEAFEVKDGKIVIVAFRQGGMEAMDIGDAIMAPGDGCRTVYPYFDPPAGSFNRRSPFVWRTGEPIENEKPRIIPGSASFSSSPTTGVEYSHAYKRRSTNPAGLLSSNKGNTKSGLLSDGEDEREGSSGIQEDLLVLGRSQDKVYLCDRRYGNFRLMTLEPKSI
ncbi:2878_t:CDS:2, partial [Acaulospora colombiana]